MISLGSQTVKGQGQEMSLDQNSIVKLQGGSPIRSAVRAAARVRVSYAFRHSSFVTVHK